jgi:hypothetical protein
MAASHRDPSATHQSGADGYRTPRWVKVFGTIAVALVVAFVALHLAGRGFRHQHSPPGPSSVSARPASGPERAQQP